jgi:DNA polymerase-3 subunit delta'
VVTLEREGAAQLIPIETIRNQVVSRVGLPPHEARVRVFVIDEATAMVPASANALLKTLEEPPARTMFVLSTRAPDQLLPTIRSRCQRVVFNGVDGAELVRDDPDRAARIAALGDQVAEHVGAGAGIALAQRITEGKGDAPLVLQAAASRLGRDARAHLARGDRDAALRCSARAQAIMAWHVALTIHNANPPLAVEAVLAELARSAP